VAVLVRLEAKPPSAAAVVAAPRRVVDLKRVAAAWQAAADSRVAAALRAAAGSRVAVLKRVAADSRVEVAARADGPERLVATAAVRAKAAAPEKRAAAKPGARVLGAVADEAGAADLSPCSDAISAGRRDAVQPSPSLRSHACCRGTVLRTGARRASGRTSVRKHFAPQAARRALLGARLVGPRG
jgi:hypothetical protein